MQTIAGLDALYMCKAVSKLKDGCFTLAFYPYNRTKDIADSKLRVMEGCTYRSQLPQDTFEVDGDNYFLFNDSEGRPKSCYRILLRFIGFPNNNFIMRKINWLHNE
jgi:hypothetical protein